jgi:hypothetical protein
LAPSSQINTKNIIKGTIDINGRIFYIFCGGNMDRDGARDEANILWAGNRDRLLPGERPQTRYSDDAEHWVRVYTDLLAFNLEMMDVIERRLATVPSADGPERSDCDLLRAHVRRLRWRLGFWQRRRAQLKPRTRVAEAEAPATTAIP